MGKETKITIKKLIVEKIKEIEKRIKENKEFLDDDLLDIYYHDELKKYKNIFKELEESEIEII